MKTTQTKMFRADFPGSVGFILAAAFHFLRHSPRIFRLSRIRRRSTADAGSLRILMVGDNMDGIHGISVSARRLVHQLRREGHRAWLMGVAHSANEPGVRDEEGWVRMFRPSSAQELFGYEGKEMSFPHLPDLLDFLEANPVDLVEIESPGFVGILFAVLCRAMGIPVVHNYRTDLVAYFEMLLDNRMLVDLLRWVICLFLRSGDAEVIVPSEAFVAKVHEMGVPLRRIHFIRRGVDLSRFSPDRRDPGYWESMGAPPGPVVSYLGRVSREKGLETLAEAFEILLSIRPDAVLGIIGDGPWLEDFRRWMEPTGRALFTGELGGEDLPRALASSEIFAFPSVTDTFGNAVLEALACGVPAVVTDQGGPMEIVEDGISGLVVPGGDPRAMARALAVLLEDGKSRRRLGGNGVLRAGLFRPDSSRDEHLAFYLGVRAAASASAGRL